MELTSSEMQSQRADEHKSNKIVCTPQNILAYRICKSIPGYITQYTAFFLFKNIPNQGSVNGLLKCQAVDPFRLLGKQMEPEMARNPSWSPLTMNDLAFSPKCASNHFYVCLDEKKILGIIVISNGKQLEVCLILNCGKVPMT